MNSENYKPESYWQERLSSNFNLKGVGLANLREPFNYWLYKKRSSRLFKELERYKLNWEQINLLEVAPGVGYYTEIFKQLGVKNLTGIDIAEVAVKKLQQKYPEYNFIQGDIGETSLENNLYHLITMIDVVFHITSDQLFYQTLKNLKNALAPNGLLVITDRFPPEDLNWAKHVRLRSFKTYKKVLTEREFNKIEIKPLVYLMSEQIGNQYHLAPKWAIFIWNKICWCASRNDLLANLVGGGFYTLERVLDQLGFPFSYAEKVLIAQKKINGGRND